MLPTERLTRLARAETQAHAHYAQPGAAGRFGPVQAVHAGVQSPLSSAWHDGSRPATPGELEALEAFCARYAQPVTLQVLSHAAAEMLPLLRDRGYALTTLLHAYTHDLKELPAQGSLDLERGGEPEVWAQWSAQGFGGGLDVMRAVAGAPGTQLFTARLDAQVAATAALNVTAGVAALYGMSTLPAFRGRGVQTGLLAARLHAAAQAGADLGSVFVTPGTISERNIVRAGFVLSGARLTFTRA